MHFLALPFTLHRIKDTMYVLQILDEVIRFARTRYSIALKDLCQMVEERDYWIG